MRIIVTTLIFTFISLCTFGQTIEELPLMSNPLLMQKTQEEVDIQTAILKKVNTPPPHTVHSNSRGAGAFIDTLYLVAGDSTTIVTDTSGLYLDTLFLQNSSLYYGNAKPIYTQGKPVKTNEFKYVSDKNVSIGKDTVRIVYDYHNPKYANDTLCYWIIVKRKNKEFTQPVTYLKAEKDTILCANTQSLTGKLVASTVSLNSLESIAKTIRKAHNYLDTCIYYQASRLGGFDYSASIILCDENQVCDKFIFPIKVLQDTLPAMSSELFMDDFSYDGPYPDPKKWLDDRVFVNNSMAVNPPSIGVATFDGLDYTGRPYGGGAGYADVLTSAYLALDSTKGPFYLSLYAQPKGLGYSPNLEDPIYIEFKNPNDTWTVIDTFRTKLLSESVAPPAFKLKGFLIPNKFLYKGFQFRIRAKASRTGINDVWNIDYVRITKEMPINNGVITPFSDIAQTAPPKPFLTKYTAAPWRHIKYFAQSEVNKTLSISAYNHFGVVQNQNSSNAKIEEEKTGTILLNNYAYSPILNFSVGINRGNSDLTDNVWLPLLDQLKTIPDDATDLRFKTTLSIALKDEQNKNYPSVLQNDIVTQTTVCSNYFAYDDGTAESVVSTKGADVQLQVKFTANVDDSLRAIEILFPYFNKDISYMRFNLRAFVKELNAKPTYEQLYLHPNYPAKYNDGLNAFTQYVLTDDEGNPKPLFIPKGDFYIGWQQVTNDDEPFVIGLDKNNPQANQYVYKNLTGAWEPLTTIRGAIMIRPKLSLKSSSVLKTNEQLSSDMVNIFPNPTTDFLNISIGDFNFADFTYQITDLSGKTIQKGKLANNLDLANLSNGLYLINIVKAADNQSITKKFSIIK